MNARTIRLMLVAIMILTNVGAAAAAPSPRPGIEGASLGNASASAQLVSCPPPTWQVDSVAIPPGRPDSTEGPFGSKSFSSQLSDPRTFEAKFKARAADNSGLLSILGCVFAGNCTVNTLWEKLAQIYDWASFSKGELTRTIDLSLQGAPAAKAEIRVEGNLDGLLLVSTLGLAHSYAEVTADLYAQAGGGDRDPVLQVNEDDDLWLSAAIFPTRITGSGSTLVTLTSGERLHLEGYLRAESRSEDLSPFLAIGASQFFDPVGGGWFDQLNPPINIPDPGLKVTATIVNVTPLLAVYWPSVLVARGAEAINSGALCDSDGDPVSLTASIGSVADNFDGTWTWRYLTGEGPAVQTVVITASDGKGDSTQVTFLLITDSVAPTTTISLSGTEGSEGWYRSDVQVTLTAADDPGGSGAATTEYRQNGGPWMTYLGPVSVFSEGIHDFSFRSIDVAGNVETYQNQPIKIDKTPPTISGSASPAPNSRGWYRGPVLVAFSASDALSGIDIVTPDLILESEGAGQFLNGAALDNAGNSARTRVSDINIDRTSPTVSIASPEPRDYLRTEAFVIQWTAADNLSGILSQSGNLDGKPVTKGSLVDGFNLSLGPHEVNVAVTDRADNSTGASVRFRVVANIDSLAESIQRAYEQGWIKQGAYNALSALLRSAEAAQERGKPEVAVKLLQAFIKVLQAQLGKGVTQQAYNLLRGDALYVISTLQ